jgi:hypothetical protein
MTYFFNPFAVSAERGTPPPPTPYDSIILADAPMLFYRFQDASGAPDAPAVDSSGNGHGGLYGFGTTGVTLVNGPPAIGGRAVQFAESTSSSRVRIPVSFQVPIDSPITIEYWRRTDNDGAQHGTVNVGNGNTPNRINVIDIATNGQLQWYYGGTTGANVAAGILTPLADGVQWYHVAVTATPTEQNVYINGVSRVTRTGNVPPNSVRSAGWVGASGFISGDTPRGSIAEFAIYDHVLTADRIMARYERGAS